MLLASPFKKFRRPALVALALALLVNILAVVPHSPTERLRVALTDQLYAWSLTDKAPRDDIAIVAIDDATLANPTYGRWQDWRRTNFAKLVNQLAQGKPKAIGLDVTFTEPSKNPADDAALAAAITQAGNVVLVARADPTAGKLLPIDTFANAAGVGFANFNVDADGVVRRVPTLVDFGNADMPLPLPSFATAVAGVAEPTRDFGNELAPIADADEWVLNFFGTPHTYKSYSFADVADGKIAPDTFAHKIVLVGATPLDLRDVDLVPTSAGAKMPGVEIHANALQTLLDRAYLTSIGVTTTLTLVTLVALAAFFIFTTLRVGRSVALLVIGGFIYLLVVSELFDAGYILDVVHPLLGLLLAFIGAYVYRYLTADREKRQLKTAFSHYLAPALVEKLGADLSALKLGGETKELTIFFSDIANFTTISEKLSAEALVKLLNDYLGAMTDIVTDSGGTLDKYIGDAVMAFWGAPLPLPNHAAAACRAALRQRDALNTLVASGNVPAGIELKNRMGLATGKCVVGNMGSRTRFNYTVMGDVVNLASRLEGVNKEYGTQIIISENVYRAAKDTIAARELDTIRVKGKKNGIAIYELVDAANALTDVQQNAFATFAAGLTAYRTQAWDDAERAFHAVLALLPDDGPSAAFLKRIAHYRVHPPTPDWDGVHTMTTK